MKAAYERITLPDSCSWGFYYNLLDEYPFTWHQHPEYELTLTVNARGRRYVADDIAAFDPDDLVLLGPDLPHSWSCESRIDPAGPIETYVVWFNQAWVDRMVTDFAEFGDLGGLFTAARRGLLFSAATGRAVRAVMRQMPALSPRRRFARLVEVLDLLAEDRPQPIASPHFIEGADISQGRRCLEAALLYLGTHYRQPLSVAALARRVGTSHSTLFRLFKRHLGQSVSDYLCALRIGKACEKLVETQEPVYVVAEEVGFGNLSNFNRSFRALKGVTPGQFRRRHRASDAVVRTENIPTIAPPEELCAVPVLVPAAEVPRQIGGHAVAPPVVGAGGARRRSHGGASGIEPRDR